MLPVDSIERLFKIDERQGKRESMIPRMSMMSIQIQGAACRDVFGAVQRYFSCFYDSTLGANTNLIITLKVAILLRDLSERLPSSTPSRDSRISSSSSFSETAGTARNSSTDRLYSDLTEIISL